MTQNDSPEGSFASGDFFFNPAVFTRVIYALSEFISQRTSGWLFINDTVLTFMKSGATR